MEEKLRNLVDRISASDMLEIDKERLYGDIRSALVMAVTPAIERHLPGETLRMMSRNPTSVTLDSYINLFTEAVQTENTKDDVIRSIMEVLDVIGTELANQGI